MEYSEFIENVIWKEYGPKAEALLLKIADLVEGDEWICQGPYNLSSDEGMWYLNIATHKDKLGNDGSIDISIKIPEQREYEGDDASEGISFALDIVEYGGRILGGLSPWNYTDRCWVDSHDEDEVRIRWEELESADISAIPDLLTS